MTTIAVLDADQLREIVRTEVIRALDDLRGIFHAAAMDAAEARANPGALDGGLITAKTLAETTGIATRELRLARHGVPLAQLAAILGHQDVRITARHYLDLRINDTKKAVEGVPEVGAAAPKTGQKKAQGS